MLWVLSIAFEWIVKLERRATISEWDKLSHGFRRQSNLPFWVDKEKEALVKPSRGLPQASQGMRPNIIGLQCVQITVIYNDSILLAVVKVLGLGWWMITTNIESTPALSSLTTATSHITYLLEPSLMSTFAYKTSTSAGSSFMYSTPLSSTTAAVSRRQLLKKHTVCTLVTVTFTLSWHMCSVCLEQSLEEKCFEQIYSFCIFLF